MAKREHKCGAVMLIANLVAPMHRDRVHVGLQV